MQIRAENDPRYSRKFLFMGICALGFALYCLYDGLVGYPARREKGFVEFKTDYKQLFKDEHRKAMNLPQFEVVAEAEPRNEWEMYAHERGIPSGPDVVMQFIMATVMSVAGLVLVSIPLRARGRWIEATDDGITSSWGESFHFNEVEVVDKRKWRSKGIAKVTYVANNRRRTLALDDYKFSRYPTDAILYELEQRIDPGRITNGPPEPAPEGEVQQVIEANTGDAAPA
jgi:hypothetical protein